MCYSPDFFSNKYHLELVVVTVKFNKDSSYITLMSIINRNVDTQLILGENKLACTR